MSLRALSDRILNRISHCDAPVGTTHVLAFSPANEGGVDIHPLAHDHWELWLARDFARGYCTAGNDPSTVAGDADMTETDLRVFAEGELRRPVVLIYFSYSVEVDGPSGTEVIAAPAYWLTPAGA